MSLVHKHTRYVSLASITSSLAKADMLHQHAMFDGQHGHTAAGDEKVWI